MRPLEAIAIVLVLVAAIGGSAWLGSHAESQAREAAATAEERLKRIEQRLELLGQDFTIPDTWDHPSGDRT